MTKISRNEIFKSTVVTNAKPYLLCTYIISIYKQVENVRAFDLSIEITKLSIWYMGLLGCDPISVL